MALCALGATAPDALAQAYAPTFATMDRMDGESHLGAQLGIVFLEEDGPQDVTPLRLDLYGQYVSFGGLAGYGLVPISLTLSDGDDETAIGNIEGGLFYVIPRQDLELVLRAGLTLPTADDDAGLIANAAGAFTRITDIAAVFPPQTMWARLSVSPVFRSGQFIVRGDLGVDIALHTDNDDDAIIEFDEPDPLIRLNVGGGIDTGTFSALLELVTLGETEDEDGVFDEDDNEFTHTLAVSGRFHAGSLAPGVALVLPLEDDLSDAYDLALLFSLEGAI